MVRDIIIDCDPGHDDSVAILMALAHPEKLNILGLTTVGGNQLLEKVTKNALRILELAGSHIPVAAGAEKPLLRPLRTGADAHGDSGMDGPELFEPQRRILEMGAVEFLYQTISRHPRPVTLVPLGPLTNIALLLQSYPEIKSKIEEICLMGGGIHVGNLTAAAEFNIYVDPEAAAIVFESGIPIIMAGLDVTHQAIMTLPEMEKLKGQGKVADFVYQMLVFYEKAGRRFGFEGAVMHDPCAIGYLLAPELFSGKEYAVVVETKGEWTSGMTLADERKIPDRQPNALVLLEVKRKEFAELVLDSLLSKKWDRQ
ncbi:nucleoside hydrolase [Clostridiales bacterium COT073_COT-073]|nr:nucleoside hydrolase [Clostridiales bacterium COT073_COT-073]